MRDLQLLCFDDVTMGAGRARPKQTKARACRLPDTFAAPRGFASGSLRGVDTKREAVQYCLGGFDFTIEVIDRRRIGNERDAVSVG